MFGAGADAFTLPTRFSAGPVVLAKVFLCSMSHSPDGERRPSSRLVSSRSAVVTMICVGVALQPMRRWTTRPMARRGFSN